MIDDFKKIYFANQKDMNLKESKQDKAVVEGENDFKLLLKKVGEMHDKINNFQFQNPVAPGEV